MDEAGPEHRLTCDELVRTVLRARVESAADAERGEELADVLLAERIERRRVARVGGDGVGAVFGGDRGELRGDRGHGVVPAHVGPRPVGVTNRRLIETIRIAVYVDHREPLVARKALGDRVVSVGGELDEGAALDVGDQPAGRLADPAERRDGATVARLAGRCLVGHVVSPPVTSCRPYFGAPQRGPAEHLRRHRRRRL